MKNKSVVYGRKLWAFLFVLIMGAGTISVASFSFGDISWLSGTALSSEAETTTTTIVTTTTIPYTPNWVSPPNSVGDDQSYILHQLGNGYWVENFYGDNYFYDYYTQVRDHKTGQVLIEDSRWNIEVWNANKERWDIIDLWNKHLEFDDSDPNKLLVRRISTDGTYTLTETYRFSKGIPKIILNFSAGDFRTYRLVWESSGIAGTKLKYREDSLSSDFSSDDSYGVAFTNDLTERFLISLEWGDAYDSFQRADWWAGSKKLDIYFGNFSGSFWLDPSWATPSSVQSSVIPCDVTGDQPWDNEDYTIDDIDIPDYYCSNFGRDRCGAGECTGDSYIIFNLGSSKTVGDVGVYGSSLCVGAFTYNIYVCDDSACSGESSIDTITVVADDSWAEKDIADTDGQWIKLARSCENYNAYFAEVKYAEGVAGDTTPPTISSESVNATEIYENRSVRFNATIVDAGDGVSDAKFFIKAPWGNQNLTYTGSSGDHYWLDCNETSLLCKTNLTGSYNCTSIWATDGTNVNHTEPVNLHYNVTAAPSDTCTCPSPAANWDVDASDNCEITSDCDISNYNLTIDGAGKFIIDANITLKYFIPSLDCNITLPENPNKITFT